MTASAEMPKYLCHKIVWALAIASVMLDTDMAENEGSEPSGSATLTPENQQYAPFTVDAEYVRKHNPQPGGYYVVYEDGYKSFSPKEAFEQGYTLAGEATPALNIADLEEMVKLHACDGRWNLTPIDFGIANGLIWAMAVLKGEKPRYLMTPDTWLDPRANAQQSAEEADQQASSLPPYQQRVVDESAQLDERLSKLKDFFTTETFAGLTHDKQQLLRCQSDHMTNYSQVLHFRISEF